MGFTLAAIAFAAKKERIWKTGHVLDSNSNLSSYVSGSVTSTSGSSTGTLSTTTAGSSTSGITTSNGQSSSSTTIQRITVQPTELLLVGEGYLYFIHDQRMRSGPLLPKVIANYKHGCRFVVGEDIKYSQEKGDLWVIDADGKECRTIILRQEKR